MGKVYILCGYSGSGKSTWAKKMVEGNKSVNIVNGDSIRNMFKAETYLYGDFLFESVVNTVAIESVKQLIAGGYDVIIDETNLTKENREQWIEVARSGIRCDISIVCFSNNKKNEDDIFEQPDESEGVSVIMAK